MRDMQGTNDRAVKKDLAVHIDLLELMLSE
jgi:hypothetical protein